MGQGCSVSIELSAALHLRSGFTGHNGGLDHGSSCRIVTSGWLVGGAGGTGCNMVRACFTASMSSHN